MCSYKDLNDTICTLENIVMQPRETFVLYSIDCIPKLAKTYKINK